MNTNTEKRQLEDILQTGLYTKIPGLVYATYDGIWFEIFEQNGIPWLDFQDDDIAARIDVADGVLAYIRYDRGLTEIRPEYKPYEIAGVRTA